MLTFLLLDFSATLPGNRWEKRLREGGLTEEKT